MSKEGEEERKKRKSQQHTNKLMVENCSKGNALRTPSLLGQKS